MKNNRNIRFLTFLMVASLSCAIGTHGVKKMEKETWPVESIEIDFKDRILSIFPVLLSNSFGVISGKPDHEALRIGTIFGNKIKENVLPRDTFKPTSDIRGICLDDNCNEMYMSANRVLSIINWKEKTRISKYWGVGEVIDNTYLKTKWIENENRLILSVFVPYYSEGYSEILNGTSVLTIEDLKNNKRIKSIPICTESGKYKQIDKTLFGRDPLVSFGPSCVIYRESCEYHWLAVNNELEYIEHPLKDTLNEYKEFFGTDLISLEIAPDQPYAIAIGQKELGQPHFAAVIQWNKAPAIMPVSLKLQKDEDIDYSSLLLSPSGRWAFFCTSRSRYFLLYIDPDLPGGCLLPFELGVTGFDNNATWITKPEGFVMQAGDKMLYWDLSKFDPQSFDAR